MFEELTTKSRLYQENHALDCKDIEELRRICREETERVRQLRTDELYAQKKEEVFAFVRGSPSHSCAVNCPDCSWAETGGSTFDVNAGSPFDRVSAVRSTGEQCT